MIERGTNENFDEERFEALLESSLDELPPDSIVPDITPWHKAMNRVVLGTALNLLRLNILWLNYILPTAGIIMLILGLRRLRKENGGFMACYALTVLRAVLTLPDLVIDATRFQSQLQALPWMTAVTWICFVIQAACILCLSAALNAVHRKAGLPGTVRGARSLVVWFMIMLALALVNYSGVVIGWIVILSFFPIVYSLSKIAGELAEAGYCVRCAPVRVSDRALTLTILGVLAAAIAFCYIFLSGYPMDWQPAPARRSEQAEQISAQLAELGYPEELLSDLTDEDILACEGAVRVWADGEERRNFRRTFGDFDGAILVRGVVVQTGDITQWRVFHHFLWLEGDFHATEAVKIWLSGDGEDVRFPHDSLGGQLLCERGGETYSAPYYSLTSGVQTDYTMFGPYTYNRISAAFTLPNRAENQRGYVCYDYELLNPERIFFYNWLNYTHQFNWGVYPVVTAEESQQNGLSRNYHFDTVQSPIQIDTVVSPEFFDID